MDTTTTRVNKKKRSRVFETYISKILKSIAPSNGITANSKQQLNSVICSISKIICDKVFSLTEISKKKTISEKEIKNAIKVLFPTDLADSIIEQGDMAISNFKNKEISKGVSRQDKACIIFPPSQSEKFLRNFGYSKTMVTSHAPVFLAGSLEFLTTLILENAVCQAVENKRVRLTIRDLELSIRSNKNINHFFKEMNICFLGGGVQPYIHPSLLKKKNKKKKSKKSDDADSNEKKKHRFRPGTVSIREIKKYQKLSNSLTFAKYPFEKILRETINQENQTDIPIKISKDVFTITQYFLEQKLIEILKKANFAAIHAGRVKLMPIDIKFISSICLGYENPHLNEELDKNEVEVEVDDLDDVEDKEDFEEEVDDVEDKEDFEEEVDDDIIEEFLEEDEEINEDGESLCEATN